MAATSTYKSFLMVYSGTGYAKVCDITEFPDLGGAPELLDATTLSDGMRVYINGIQDLEGLEFGANYEAGTYTALTSLSTTTKSYAVWFGATVSNGVATPTGSEGKFTFEGVLTPWVEGHGVNEVRTIRMQIANSTVISFSAS